MHNFSHGLMRKLYSREEILNFWKFPRKLDKGGSNGLRGVPGDSIKRFQEPFKCVPTCFVNVLMGLRGFQVHFNSILGVSGTFQDIKGYSGSVSQEQGV